MRIGQVLGLRHADFVSHRRELRIVPRRDNTNGARAKTFDEHTIPISPGLVRLYTGYMFDEYGQCDSDYVFVNLFAQPYGRPLRYQAVHQLVRRLRAAPGFTSPCTCCDIPGPPSCYAPGSVSMWWPGC